jgi:PAS domain S-box-containing protein
MTKKPPDNSDDSLEFSHDPASDESREAFQLLNAQLEQREEDLARIFDAAPDAMVLVNQAGVIERANSQIEQLFGYTQSEIEGVKVEALVPEQFRASHRNYRDQYSASPRFRQMGVSADLYGLHKDGSEFPIDVNLSPIELGGTALVAAAIRDFTEHRANRDALRDAKEVSDRATASKSRFLAAASHDLRQPLQSLGLYLSVLERRTVEPGVLEVTGKMRSSLDVMADLLDALLDISKYESGSIVPELTDINVQSIFDEIATDNAPIAVAKGLELVVRPSALVIHSDKALLKRIVENYVSNAIRYTDNGQVALVCHADDESVCIEVSDTGIGIPADALDIIFDEHYQLDNQVRDRQQGLGIGLAIVKHIGQLLSHPVAVQSELGQGSTFSVSVPLAAASVAMASVDNSEPDVRRAVSARILLIDDDPAVVDATELLLSSEGFEVATAPHGQAAEKLLEGGFNPDILVCDYRLPVKSGVELIRQFREFMPTHLHAILITGDTATPNMTELGLADCTVLLKPVNPNELIATINEYLAE